MKKPFLFFIFFFPALYADAAREFFWRIPLSGEVEAREYYRIPLPREARANSENFPRDLRIIDDNGANWPFFLERPARAETQTQVLLSRQRNALHVEGPGGYRQIDLHISGNRPSHTQVHLQTDGADFVRRVEILGSDDQETWGLMAMGFLVNTHRPPSVRESVIRYPVSDLPYLRIRVFPNTRDALESFEIRETRVERLTRSVSPPLAEHPFERLPDTTAPGGIQQIHLDLGLENQPVHALKLQLDGAEYLRRVNVLVRNRESDPWRGAGGGDLLNIEPLLQDRIQLNAYTRFLRIDLHHLDDPPLEAETIRVFYRTESLITQAPEPPGNPFLYLGSEFAAAPRFDLEGRWNRMSQSPQVRPLTPSALEANPAHRSGLSGHAIKILSVLIVGMTSALVIGIIYRMMTHPPSSS